MDLIYGSLITSENIREDEEERKKNIEEESDNSNFTNDDNDISTAKNQQYWKYTHQQFR